MKFCLSIITLVTLAGDNTTAPPPPANTRAHKSLHDKYRAGDVNIICQNDRGVL